PVGNYITHAPLHPHCMFAFFFVLLLDIGYVPRNWRVNLAVLDYLSLSLCVCVCVCVCVCLCVCVCVCVCVCTQSHGHFREKGETASDYSATARKYQLFRPLPCPTHHTYIHNH